MGFISSLASMVNRFTQSHSNQVTSTSDVGWNNGGSISSLLNFSKNFLKNSSGTQLDPDTALEVSVFWACVQKISKDLAKLKIEVKKRDNNGRITTAPRHRLNALLNVKPSTNSMVTSFTFVETMLSWALRYQSGFAHVERDAAGFPISLDLIHPSRVTLQLNPRTRRLEYIVANDPATAQAIKGFPDKVVIPEADMFALHGMGDGQTGFPITNAASEALGIAKAAQGFQGTFFGNGLHIDSILVSPKQLTTPVKEEMKRQWTQTFGRGNSNSIAILDADLDWKPVEMRSIDAQLLETRKFQIAEIARYFDMPLHKIQDMSGATFSNIEQQSLEYVGDTLTPWAVRFADEAQLKLLPTGSAFFIMFDFWPLIRGDLKTQADYFSAALGGGSHAAWMNVDEVRSMAVGGLNPVPNGDIMTMPLNVTDVSTSLRLSSADANLKETNAETAANPPALPAPAVDDPEQIIQPIDFDQYRGVLSHAVQMEVNREKVFHNRYKDRRPEDFAARQKKFYANHEPQMTENLGGHVKFLHSQVDLADIVQEAFLIPKDDETWPTRVTEFLTESILAASPDQVSTAEDGFYLDEESGDLYEMKNGQLTK